MTGALPETDARFRLPGSSGRLKLFCNFVQKKIYYDGSELPFDRLRIEGAVHFDTVRGMGVFKGGVNEVIDPRFEGSGWSLGDGASIDSSDPFVGKKCLRIDGSGEQGVIAHLKERIAVGGGETRAISFYKNCRSGASGEISVRCTAFDGDGTRLGDQSLAFGGGIEGWQREGFIWRVPHGTKSYSLEVVAAGFSGVCLLDAFLSEPKDFFTPYFDGDCPSCNWVRAATPQHPTVNVDRGGWLKNPLQRRQAFFYRLSAVDNEGRESSASFEVKATTGRRRRRVLLTWDRDPEAVRYRIYRGPTSRGQDEMIEVNDDEVVWSWSPSRGIKPNGVFGLMGNTAIFRDSAKPGAPDLPRGEAGTDTGEAHASRSLRPDADVRLMHNHIGINPRSDFWLAAEVEFGFSNSLAFRPASFFEIGDPLLESLLAVSVRFFPEWGDEYPKILLIRMGRGSVNYVAGRLPEFKEGSVIRLVASQVYVGGTLPAGAHLWYTIDNGEMNHLSVDDVRPIEKDVLLTISKRFYYDYFANNSYCRMLAAFQGAPEETSVKELLRKSAGLGMIKVIGSLAGPGT